MANWTSVSVGFVRFALTAIEKFILGITLARRETKGSGLICRSGLKRDLTPFCSRPTQSRRSTIRGSEGT